MGLRTIDLFCGGGGSSWGARAAGANIVCGVDAWEFATTIYNENFGPGKAKHLTLSSKTKVSDLGDLGKVDLLLASPECTNHTCARGNRPKEAGSRETANYVLRFAEQLDPRWIVVENVVHMKKWDGYEPFIAGLKALNYNVRTETLNAADFGVPQTRRRLFVICDRNEEPTAVKRPRGKRKTVKSILDPEGTWESRPLYKDGRAEATIERAERAIDALGKRESFLVVYYGSDGAGGWQSLDRPLRTMTTLDRFGLVTWDGKTPMLRMLQVSELTRAMGFSNTYKLVGDRRSRIKVLGNGVAPPVMEHVVSSLTQ
ncbi:MAG: DNA cytosine methyltransferase [Verrucomicrobiaceae bacterium]|nr:MAG: DNA cytosine methyltransferase [Verrucomicrobiaceae bacterium]